MSPPWPCPVCRAPVTVSPCRRCRVDLGLLFALESRRDALLADARRAAGEGAWSRARSLAAEATSLRRGDDATRLAAVASLMLRDYPAARTWHARLGNPAALSRE